MADFKLALTALRIPFRQGTDPNEITICCVFCVERGFSQDTRFRLGINISKGLAHCWNCEFKTKQLGFLAKKLELGDVDGTFFGATDEEEIKPEVELPDDFERVRFSRHY